MTLAWLPAAATAAGIFLTAPEIVRAAVGEPKLVLHARRADAALPCDPGITNCESVVTVGQLYAPGGAYYFVYLLAARVDPDSGLGEVQFGINFDPVTGTGVDLFQWSLCAESQSPGEGWFQSGHATNRIDWNGEHCPTDTLAVGGYFYLTSYTPAAFSLVPPDDRPAHLSSCGGTPHDLVPTDLGYLFFGAGPPGCNPCEGPCIPVAVEATTWSRLKAFTGSVR